MASKALKILGRVVLVVLAIAVIIAFWGGVLCLAAKPFLWVSRHTFWLGQILLCDEGGWMVLSSIMQLVALSLVLNPVIVGWQARKQARLFRLAVVQADIHTAG